MKKLVIKNATSGRYHTLGKFLPTEQETMEYVVLDLILAEDKAQCLKEIGFNGVVDNVLTDNDTTYIKFHVDWESEQGLYDEEGEFVKTETKITTAYYLMIIG